MSEPTPPRPIEKLALALQECFNEAADQAIRKIEPRLDRMDQRLDRMDQRLDHMDQRLDRMDQRLGHQDKTIRQMRDHMDVRLDRQDETLRMVWKQVKGNGALPIDRE